MDISVVIPLSHSPELTRACLESLGNTMSRRWRYEVIISGAGTPRNVLESLPASPGHRLLSLDPSRGRAACLNAAAKVALAPVLCLLDPGTTLMPGWLEPMHGLLRREKKAACIGNIQREPYSGLIDHAGLTFRDDGLPVSAARHSAVPPAAPFTRRAAVSAACCLLERGVFHRLGGFDERFQRCYDDVDFCLRAAEAGLRTFVANRSVVYRQPFPLLSEDEDRSLYLARWGERARAYHQEKAARLARPLFSPESWEAARESRRQRRQDVRDVRQDGRRYLGKHLLRPWRYNYERVCQALVRSVHPAPAAIPRPPNADLDGLEHAADCAVSKDAVLFDPPRR